MKLKFIGATHQVTGSMHYIETSDLKFLVDCGMEQGGIKYDTAELPVSYKELDYILLTHAHIDHSGMLPKAVANGFNGTILATDASMDLDRIMLLDSANIQEQDAEQENRKGKRAGREPVEPEYTVEDAERTLEFFRPVPYHEMIELSDTVRVRFIDAGHLLGSASIEIWIREGGVEKKIVFSGDIGNDNKPIIRNPEYIHEADYVVMESTYGNRTHETGVDHITELAGILQRTLDRGGNVIFPAFAVGRTQELLYLIRAVKEKGLVKGHDHFPVYVDSPMAVEATQVFKDNLLECYDDETKQLVSKGINPIGFEDLKLSRTVEDSKAIQADPTPKVVISAAGMCNAGRIRHHLKHNLWRPECSIVFAGYQAEGTLGRMLQDGIDEVKLFGEEIVCRAEICTMTDMSSHADRNELLKWIGTFGHVSGRVFLVHGEDDSMESLAEAIREQTGNTVEMPYSGSEFDLAANKWDYVAEPKFIKKEKAVFTRNEKVNSELDKALKAITELVNASMEGANADKIKLTRKINELVEKMR